jgi:outer membrane protein assembly factor BamE (lipoprotein component of BamABCDE complex)
MTRPSHNASVITVNRRRPAPSLSEDARVPIAATSSARTARQMLVALGILALSGGCTSIPPFRAPEILHGNRVDDYRLKELVPGTSTQADVTALIGSPTAKATFDANTWLYLSEVTHIRIARTPGVSSQAVVALSFDDRGVLRDIKTLDQADEMPVTVVARATPSPGTSASFLQQLFGNVGKFNPLGPGAAQSAGGGAPGLVGAQ